MAEHLIVNDTTPRIQYVADGTQTAFPYPFVIFTTDDMVVYLDDTEQADGYTVAGAGVSTGGTVTFAAAPANGVRVTLLRRLVIERTSDFQDGGSFRAKVVNDELDRLTAAVQQVSEIARRAVVWPAYGAAAPRLELPEPAAGRGLKWSAAGDGLVNSETDPDALAAASAADRLASETSRAEAEAAAVAAGQSATDAANSAAAAADSAAAAEAAAGGGAVKVSSSDTTVGLLAGKLVAGNGIRLEIQNAGGDESLLVRAKTGTAAGDLVQLEENDRLPAVDGSLLTNLPTAIVGAGALNSNAQSVPSGTPTLLAPAEVWDSHGAYASGIFTAPETGVYRVSVYLQMTFATAYDNVRARWHKNGVLIEEWVLSRSTAAGIQAGAAFYFMSLNAGDTASVFMYQASGYTQSVYARSLEFVKVA